MTDNLFDRLADLFRAPGPVNWRLAREIAESVAGPPTPVDPWADEQLRELTGTAQRLVTAESSLDALAADEGIRVVDRRQWASANVESLAYLAEPIADRLALAAGDLGPALQPLGPSLIGMQVGALIGFTSHRALGQFDAGLTGGQATPVTLVAKNVDELATGAGVDAAQVRLWAALREVTHHTELAVPWVREHLLMLGHAHGEEFEIDDEAIAERLTVLQDPESLQAMMEGGEDLAALQVPIVAGESAERIEAFVAFIDGYGDLVAERVGSPYLPDLSRIRNAATERRVAAAPSEAMLHRALGLAPDPHSPAVGAAFCSEVARRWGDDALDRVWEGPEMLPTPAELTDATGWAARVLL